MKMKMKIKMRRRCEEDEDEDEDAKKMSDAMDDDGFFHRLIRPRERCYGTECAGPANGSFIITALNVVATAEGSNLT